MERRVYYTGDLITPDGSDTWVYGDPCEAGHGATLESGWVSPDWSLWTVYGERDDVTPDTREDDEEQSPAAWLAETVTGRLGSVEDNGDGTFYAADTAENYRTGESMSLAAHAYGFSDTELSAASDLIAGRA